MKEELIERLRMTEQMLNAAHFKEAESLIREARDAIEELQSKLTASRRLKKGKWILSDEQRQEDVDNDNYRFICSECGRGDLHSKEAIVSFCWNCGADMRGEEK